MQTKFRAFQLDTNGSLFSYYKPGEYTLIEARIPKAGVNEIAKDLGSHGKTTIDTLHITSWDNDHCNYDSLKEILNRFRPNLIEVPGYEPDTDSGIRCKRIIMGYDIIHEQYNPNAQVVSKDFIARLPPATAIGTSNIFYNPKMNTEKKNDMSLIKLFRSGGFNVLSLGDCECPSIAESITFPESLIRSEVDVLILPHHGADNGFISGDFLDAVKPKIAICSSNYGNQYDHPRPEVRALLTSRDIRLFSTKTGDVHIIHHLNTSESIAYNMQTNNQEISEKLDFIPKRHA